MDEICYEKTGYKTYDDYLNTEHWQQQKTKYKGTECVCCGATGDLYLHHRSYKRLGKEYCTELVTLCGHCHDKTHQLVRNKEATLFTAHLYVADSFHYKPEYDEIEWEWALRRIGKQRDVEDYLRSYGLMGSNNQPSYKAFKEGYACSKGWQVSIISRVLYPPCLF